MNTWLNLTLSFAAVAAAVPVGLVLRRILDAWDQTRRADARPRR